MYSCVCRDLALREHANYSKKGMYMWMYVDVYDISCTYGDGVCMCMHDRHVRMDVWMCCVCMSLILVALVLMLSTLYDDIMGLSMRGVYVCMYVDVLLCMYLLHICVDVYDESLSSFFRNVDTRTGRDLPFYSSLNMTSSTAHTVPLASLKARAILVDMEEGVINNLMKSELRDLFDTSQTIRDVSGAGNNWAHGHEQYGPQYGQQILDTTQKAVEAWLV